MFVLYQRSEGVDLEDQVFDLSDPVIFVGRASRHAAVAGQTTAEAPNQEIEPARIDVSAKFGSVSRDHATLQKVGSYWMLSDGVDGSASKGGVYINGAKINNPHVLKHSDLIVLAFDKDRLDRTKNRTFVALRYLSAPSGPVSEDTQSYEPALDASACDEELAVAPAVAMADDRYLAIDERIDQLVQKDAVIDRQYAALKQKNTQVAGKIRAYTGFVTAMCAVLIATTIAVAFKSESKESSEFAAVVNQVNELAHIILPLLTAVGGAGIHVATSSLTKEEESGALADASSNY